MINIFKENSNMNFFSQLIFSISKVSTSKKMVESYVFVGIIAGCTAYAAASLTKGIGLFLVFSFIWLCASTSIFMMSDRGKRAFELERANRVEGE